jgi:hypothetical protein
MTHLRPNLALQRTRRRCPISVKVVVGQRLSFYLQCSLLILAVGCGISEIRTRSAALQKLAATNAPLTAVQQEIGRIPIYRRESAEWLATRSNHARNGSANGKRMLQKIERAAAFGHTSTISMQTWIFLDENDRLIDYEVAAQ